MHISKREKRTFRNPILPGFYPDPSICRVNEDYYLVTSSFVYFPGVPIFHSRDLVHWEQIGHVLDRESQLKVDGAGHSRGIFAPTIRYHKGTFYMICTNVSDGGNFIVTATDPAGPWSDPYWLKDAPGIDPSLFFDDDGKAYYTGTRPAPEGERYSGNWEIWLRELDLTTMTLVGETYGLWRGAMKDVIWPEGPHIYKVNGEYLLMHSEGGTCYHHAVCVAKSKSITGPYVGNPANPILTHRHLGRSYPIMNVGHTDLVETQNGEYWMVALASRPYGGYYRNLGRETFLVPVTFVNGWPVACEGTGKVEFEYESPDLPLSMVSVPASRDDFNDTQLAMYWNFLRTPRESFWSLTEKPGFLRLKLRPEKIIDEVNPSFVARRQQHIFFTASTAMEFVPANEDEAAGIVVIQNNLYHFRLECTLSKGQSVVRVIRCENGVETNIGEQPVTAGRIYLKVIACGQDYSFYCGTEEKSLKIVAENADGRMLSTDVADGFVGTCLGMYASSNGKPSTNQADFDWFEYIGE